MDADQRIEFRKVRSVTDVINATFHFIRQNYILLGKSLLYIVGPVLAVSVIMSAFFQTRILTFAMVEPESMDFSWMGEFFGLMGVMMIASFFSALLAVLVVLGFVRLYEEHGPQGFELDDVWRVTKENFWRMFGTMAAVVGLMLLPVPIVIVPCLGILAYLAWIVYVLVVFSLTYPMRMQEPVSMGEALGRARALARQDFWPTFGALLLAYILYYMIYSAFSMPASILGFLYAMHAIEGSGSPDLAFQAMMVAATVLAGIAGTLLYSIPMLAIAFQYFNLVERKERVGLLNRIDMIEPDPGVQGSGV